jgi:hypothetical protein
MSALCACVCGWRWWTQVTDKVQPFVKVLRKLDSSSDRNHGPVFFLADVFGVSTVDPVVVGTSLGSAPPCSLAATACHSPQPCHGTAPARPRPLRFAGPKDRVNEFANGTSYGGDQYCLTQGCITATIDYYSGQSLKALTSGAVPVSLTAGQAVALPFLFPLLVVLLVLAGLLGSFCCSRAPAYVLAPCPLPLAPCPWHLHPHHHHHPRSPLLLHPALPAFSPLLRCDRCLPARRLASPVRWAWP